jgi:tRNA pseudouridine38-40 synthase
MAVIRLQIEYDGSAFSGWASQPGLRTVQAELEDALATVLREEVRLSVAGRTDAGVHAWGQIASFEAGLDQIPGDLARRLNGVLPDDVIVTNAARAPDGFDARRDALSRTYCYRILARPAPSPFERGRALWWPGRLDRPALDGCAATLIGRHDFTAFTPTDTEHVRFEREVMRAEWRLEGADPRMPGSGSEDMRGILCFWIEADAFMRNMVRVLVGTMLQVGAGRRTQASFEALLEGRPREEAGDTAPAHGLYLAAVRYQP